MSALKLLSEHCTLLKARRKMQDFAVRQRLYLFRRERMVVDESKYGEASQWDSPHFHAILDLQNNRIHLYRGWIFLTVFRLLKPVRAQDVSERVA